MSSTGTDQNQISSQSHDQSTATAPGDSNAPEPLPQVSKASGNEKSTEKPKIVSQSTHASIPSQISNQISLNTQRAHQYIASTRVTPANVAKALELSTLEQSEWVDIIIYAFLDGICCRDKLLVRSLEELNDFFNISRGAQPEYSFLLLVEDIGENAIKLIDKYSPVRQTAGSIHTKGRVNSQKDTENFRLHTDRVQAQSTLFDYYTKDEDRDSMTWWRLFSHSRNGYTRETEALSKSHADTSKIIVPHFEIQISDTQMGDIPMDLRGLDTEARIMHRWNKVLKSTGINAEMQTNPKWTEKAEAKRYEVTEYILDCSTYRPHQVITETVGEVWGTAAEERVTFNWFENTGSKYYILLFDAPRGVREKISTFEHKALEKSYMFGPVLISEDEGHMVSTFLSDDPQITKGTGLRRRVTQVKVQPEKDDGRRKKDGNQGSKEEKGIIAVKKLKIEAPTKTRKEKHFGPDFPLSSRSRFIEKATREGLLGESSSRLPIFKPDQVLQMAKFAFARVAAEDWNLVLSQMAFTLDDIDSKMSDNSLLQSNALTWRRLLSSWRVSMVEYGTRLNEAKRSLSHEPTQRPSIISTASDTSDDSSVSPRSVDEQSIVQLFDILLDGLQRIDKRVDRTFHAIMSSMSILESERAIEQGVAITRLTELAFFFIPLSFAAAFFSMQIKEFETHQPRLGHFFIMGVVLILFLYLLRAFIRSTILTKYKTKFKKRIRETSRLPSTEDIPTRVVVSYLWQQLDYLVQICIVVLPFTILAMVLIGVKGHGKVFKGIGISMVFVGSTIIIALLYVKQKVLAAIRTTVIVTWMVSMIGATIGSEHRPNPAVLGAVCVSVTTVCGIILAVLPQTVVRHVARTLLRYLLPLWLVVLPFTVILHYYYHNSWESYQLILGTMTIVIVFGIISSFTYGPATRWIFQILALIALICGIPLTLAWTVWPLAKTKTRVNLPHGVRVAITVFACTLFTILAPLVLSESYQESDFSWYSFLLLSVVVVPVTTVWYLLPATDHYVPLYVQVIVSIAVLPLWLYMCKSSWRTPPRPRAFFIFLLLMLVAVPVTAVWMFDAATNGARGLSLVVKSSVTVGSVLALGISMLRFTVFRSEGWRVVSWVLCGLTMMSWIPMWVWATDWDAFDSIRQSRSKMIHLTWGTTLPLFILWLLSWRWIFTTMYRWTPSLARQKKTTKENSVG